MISAPSRQLAQDPGVSVVVTGTGTAVPGLEKAGDLFTGKTPERPFDPKSALKGREMRNKDRASRLALYAAQQALGDAGLLDEAGSLRVPGTRTAVVVSSNLGTLQTVCDFTDTIARETVTGLSPLGLPQTSSNVVAGWIAIRHGLRGPNLTVCNGATSGLDAMHWAHTLIRAGRCERAVVVGVEPASEHAGKLLGRPAHDVTGAVVVETADLAAARSWPARATVAAYARRANLAAAVAAVEVAAPGPVELWLTTGQPRRPAAAVGRTLDVTALLGDCSGALGVLQCAAAAAHMDEHSTAAALAVTGGGDADEATAALLLTAA